MNAKKYIVRFERNDEQFDEEYFYNNLEEAEDHFNLFLNDDSGLYKTIELIVWLDNSSLLLNKIEFSN